jgi:hypothetical protein
MVASPSSFLTSVFSVGCWMLSVECWILNSLFFQRISSPSVSPTARPRTKITARWGEHAAGGRERTRKPNPPSRRGSFFPHYELWTMNYGLYELSIAFLLSSFPRPGRNRRIKKREHIPLFTQGDAYDSVSKNERGVLPLITRRTLFYRKKLPPEIKGDTTRTASC